MHSVDAGSLEGAWIFSTEALIEKKTVVPFTGKCRLASVEEMTCYSPQMEN